MLLFILLVVYQVKKKGNVSIHLMLLFIGIKNKIKSYITSFNTSHVTLYHNSAEYHVPGDSFQYISCYSLSISTFFWMRSRTRFNTSHVTLYRSDRCRKPRDFNEFQYISCYSLSLSRISPTVSPACFNTSHVTLYPEGGDLAFIITARFNTSHVTLYPGAALQIFLLSFVSIHLMLLFILKKLLFHQCFTIVSIHLMLLFIESTFFLSSHYNQVSIHLMLLFIRLPCFHLHIRACFNTSHVTLYRTTVYFTVMPYLGFNTSHVTLYLHSIRIPKFLYLRFNTSHVTLYLIF